MRLPMLAEFGDRWGAYCDEEGRLKGLPQNLRIPAFVGHVVISKVDAEGDELGLTTVEAADLIARLMKRATI